MSSRRHVVAKAGAILAFAASSTLSLPARAEFPTLERAIQMARARAIVVAQAEAEIGVAQAQMASAKQSSIGNPYTDVQVDRNWDTSNGIIQALTYTYFPIDIGGQRGKRIDEAERLIDWRKLGLVDARALATGDVVGAYGELVIGNARITEATTGEQTARDEAKYFAGRLEARDTTVYEKALADAEVARWVQARAEATLRVTAARARYEQVTGSPTTEMPAASSSLYPPALRAKWDDAYVAQIIDRTPIVARLNAERHYWDASGDRYKRERLPPLAFEVIAGRGGAGEARFGLGAVITFPITRRYQGEIARAEKGEETAARQLELYRTILTSRLRAARDAIAAVEKAVKELDESGMPALEKAVSASNEGFKLGKIELTRVLLARRDLALARARRLDLLEAAWRAYADLVILSGDLP